MGDKSTLNIGVLAVQGSFEEHVRALEGISKTSSDYNINVFEVRCSEDIRENMQGLILPGGESTTLSVFFKDEGFYAKIKEWASDESKFVMGTCMGMILLSNNVQDQKAGGQIKIGGIDITVARNHYGRQLHSFETKLSLEGPDFPEVDSHPSFHGIFIRAPGIISINNPGTVTILASFLHPETREKEVVGVRQGRLLACSFHPELTPDVRFHQYFANIIFEGEKMQK
uniref:glutaminase n=1 Tax=Caligus rogercresseyi TaxID=217165 RepID=C1BP06_CALRO|nr:Glutamine amidotransferase subunit pdxT [Caligus rogercresseyi]|eukprot:TRINITY_DN8877_c0_g1_i1.p1 TRINITY_DN8877_c0_g1~~TRINITY_DN8877_c0_g1_i1.p1  ORF type:complete len:228 (-),score=27.67 TRINITY_DN8877_c0_g1_i1:16-699(-)